MPTEIVHVVNDEVDVWEVRQAGYFGSWAGFSDEQVCRNFALWLDATFDTDGITARLFGDGNTPEDLECIRLIKQRKLHVTHQENTKDETWAHRFHRERGTPDWE
jgi:hypothetical protein